MTEIQNPEDGRQIENHQPPKFSDEVNAIISHCTDGEGDHVELIFRLNFMGLDRKAIVALVSGLYATDGNASSAIQWRERTEATLDAIKAFYRMRDNDQIAILQFLNRY